MDWDLIFKVWALASPILIYVCILVLKDIIGKDFVKKTDHKPEEFVKKTDAQVAYDKGEDAIKRIHLRIDENRKEIDRENILLVKWEDRLGALEKQFLVLQERHSQEWKRIADQMQATSENLDRAATKMDEISRQQSELALELARIKRNGN